ncbi:hypothetical protein KC340_g106 [Hortaea werneckii]|nr:hypothetical protein KC340_g106 [Hortaea werneckii]
MARTVPRTPGRAGLVNDPALDLVRKQPYMTLVVVEGPLHPHSQRLSGESACITELIERTGCDLRRVLRGSGRGRLMLVTLACAATAATISRLTTARPPCRDKSSLSLHGLQPIMFKAVYGSLVDPRRLVIAVTAVFVVVVALSLLLRFQGSPLKVAAGAIEPEV